MKDRYSKQIENQEHVAKALGMSLPISPKHSIEICNLIRHKKLEKAKIILEKVIEKKAPIPFKRFQQMGHKKGKTGPGRYPVNACKEILKVLNSAEANAQFKGLNTSNLVIAHIATNRAAQQWHYGRQRRRKMKRAHVQVMLEEKAEKKPQKENKKQTQKTGGSKA